ncbi:MAG: dienelactone hydrolase family protein [Xanthobacteraceae bacterium]
MQAAVRTFLIACMLAMASFHQAGAATAAELAGSPKPDGTPVTLPGPDIALDGVLYRPDGPGPFPAIVALHGCEGLRRHMGERDRAWARHLTDSGFVVLFPDSFGSRHLGSQCRVRRRLVSSSRERVADANAALRWLQAQSFVKPDRVSLLGWSNGASTVLWTVRRASGPEEPRNTDFRTAVALYPGCRRSHATAWSARVPTLVLIGAKDDWTPASACEQMIAGARGRSAQVAIVVYRGAYHGFDHPSRPLREVKRVARSADGSGTVHVGTDTAARADALKRVLAWLAR